MRIKKLYADIFKILELPEKNTFTRLIIADIFLNLLDIAFLAFLLYVVQFYTQPEQSRFSIPLFKSYPLLLIVSFFVVFSLKNLFGYRVAKSQFVFRSKLASRISRRNMQLYLDGNFRDYTRIDSSIHIRRISQQPIEFCHYIIGGLQQVTGQLVLITLTTVAIIVYNTELFLLLLLVLSPPVILASWLMKRKMNTLRKSARLVSEKSLQYLKEGLNGFVEGNLYQSKEFFTNRYHHYQYQFNQFLASQQSVQNLPSRLIEVFAILGLLLLVLINSISGNSNSVSLITIGAFMAGAYKIIPGIVRIINSMGQIKAYDFTLQDILKSSQTINGKEIISVEKIQSIRFEKLHFRFDHHKQIDNFNFNIHKGDFIGLSGISGKGKTTLINLLLGFLEPEKGKISINNIPVNPNQLKSHRKRISYLRQENFLIHDTILKNITLSEETDHHRLEYSLRATGMFSFLTQLPAGIDTLLTENGKNISGGQRQLVAIARALYKDSEVIILDEPFNELDYEKESKLVDHLQELATSGKIIILVSHNKDILQRCSKIISLDED